jgi:hypothetical protein
MSDLPDGFFEATNFSLTVLIVGVVGTIAMGLLIIFFLLDIFSKLREDAQIRKSKKVPEKKLKQKYLGVLDDVSALFEKNVITEDGVYYEVSRTLKNYASEKTGEDITSLTREDISNSDTFILLHEMISELYVPEFSNRKLNPTALTTTECIDKARELIGRW